ncbi:hypothetical protein [Luteolibacter luteus]|uniref:EF-hand domain-containing protein n=1 Tax=Luteolibacter luteus TaxID=2728835 RepID=A0A858RQR5_9BACT|nr:hypothetical protein [Luteolibacter luteus]QJE99085.1 hypothetical protein HHL09_26000 [Luteolibacter luteus]
MFSTRPLLPLLLAAAGISSLPAASTPLSLVIREDQRLSVSGLPAELAAKSFGGQLQVSGNTAIFLGSGIQENSVELGVYVYVFENGSWNFQQRILGNYVPPNSEFGHAIAIDGDTIVISASAAPNGAIQNAGCLLVYTRNNGVWDLQAKLHAKDSATGDFLGDGIAIHDDTILTLAHGDINNSGNNAGNAYIFHRANGIWTQQADLPTSTAMLSTSPYEERPLRVALHGDVAVVGSPFDEDHGAAAGGKVFVFGRRGSVWTAGAPLVLTPTPQPYEFAGTTVATDGRTILVGAVQGGVTGGEGKVYVCRLQNSGAWQTEQVLTDGNSDAIDAIQRFGSTLDIEDDTLLIGGPGASSDGLGTQAGSAFVFRRDAQGSWQQLRRLLPEGTDNGGTGFGSAMALHGRDSMLIASKEEDGTITFDPTLNNRGVILSLSLITPQGMPLYLLTRADKNHDEFLSTHEWDTYFPVDRLTATVFGMIDANRSEGVDYLELDAALADPAAPRAYHLWMDYLEMTSELDADGDLLLSRDELLSMYPPGKAGAKKTDAFLKRLKISSSPTIPQWFRGKGLPTMAQYDAAILARSQRGELAAQLDTDEDGQVSRQEFAALFPVKVAVGKVDAAWRSATGTPKKVALPAEISIGGFIEAPVLPKVKK